MYDFRAAMKLIGLLLLSLLIAASTGAEASADSKRAKVRKQSQEIMANLYATVPGSKDVVANAAGYATFRKLGVKIGAVGGGGGRGLAVDKAGNQTFMMYAEASAGLGLGIKSFDLIFVFDTPEAQSAFVNKGWEAGSDATAAAKHGDSGSAVTGAASVSPGVRVYQLTKSGLALELNIKGTKYFKDKKLNAKE
jgi:lipid-binding SYLF domain-containing protein